MDDKFNLDDFLKDAKLVDPPKMDLDDVWKQSNFQNPFGDLLPDMRNVPNAHDDIEKRNKLLETQVKILENQSALQIEQIETLKEQSSHQIDELRDVRDELSKANEQRQDLQAQIKSLQDEIDKIRSNSSDINLSERKVAVNTKPSILIPVLATFIANVLWFTIQWIVGAK